MGEKQVLLLVKDKIIQQIMRYRYPGDEMISNRAKQREVKQQANRVTGCFSDTK
jgi:hypothetical protein